MSYDKENLVPIKEYTISKRGLRGLIIALPTIWARRIGLAAGDKVEFLQSPNSTDLIIRVLPKSKSNESILGKSSVSGGHSEDNGLCPSCQGGI